MTIQGWTLILVFTAHHRRARQADGAVAVRALRRAAHAAPRACSGRSRRGFYKLAGIDPTAEQSWRRYAVHMLLFQLVTLLFTYAILRLQGVLPMNPRGLAGIGADGAFNTAISFTTNTNWQWYSGEVALSNLSQMLGLTIHNFLSAATGIAIAFALFRGFARREASGHRQFLGRSDARDALPAAAALRRSMRVFLIASGVPQTFASLGRCDHARRRDAAHRASARSPRRKRSRCSAPMAAASSTPTPRIRSRTRPR